MMLRQLLELYGKRHNSRLIMALDVTTNMYEAVAIENLLNSVSKDLLGVKIGVPTILSYGLHTISKWIDSVNDVLWIVDLKLADIGYVARQSIEQVYEAGFDAVIMHGFIGFEDGLVDAVEYASDLGISPILVAAMSHRGGMEYLNRVSADMVMRSLEIGLEGYVLPATYPILIKMYRGIVGDRVIIAPGVGAQGARPRVAVEHGADAEIVGRRIYMADDPISEVKRLHGVLTWR